MIELRERFWRDVDTSGECWEWKRALQSRGSHGYGIFYVRWDREASKSILMLAHRFAWESANGPIPAGMDVCHHCDNPKCCRPDHLFIGTARDNNVDFMKKERYGANVKLGAGDINPIRLMHGEGWTITDLAKQFGVSRRAIGRVVYGVCWRFVPLVAFAFFSCARSDFFFPPDGKSVVTDERGRPRYYAHKAAVLNGVDSLGGTHVLITRNSLEFSNQGGLDASTTTRGWQRTIRYGAGAATTAVLGVTAINAASSAYGANQAQVAASNASAAKASAANAAAKGASSKLPQVGSQIPAQTQATVTVPAAPPAAIPAAGSTIQSTVPATVVPVP